MTTMQYEQELLEQIRDLPVEQVKEVLPLWEEAQSHMVEGMGQARFSGWLAQLSEVAGLAQGA